MHRRVDRGAFSALPARAVRRIDFRQPQAPAEHGFDIAKLLGLQARIVHETLHTGKAQEIFFDIVLRGRTFDAEIASEAECTHSIDQAEVDYLCVAALFAGHVGRHNAEYLGGGRTMNVFAIGKGTQHVGVFRQMRHDAQLDLRVISRHDDATGRRDERFANTPAFGGTDRNVLQIRFIR